MRLTSVGTPSTVGTLNNLPAGNYVVSVVGEGSAGTNAMATLTCSISPTTQSYAPRELVLDGLVKSITAAGGAVLTSPGQITFACSYSGPPGSFVVLRGAMTAVRVGSLN